MRWLFLSLFSFPVLVLGACSSSANDNAHTTATTTIAPSPTQVLAVTARPARIDKILRTHEIAQGKPILKILAPQPDQILRAAQVQIRVSTSGDYHPFVKRREYVEAVLEAEDHIHIMLDNIQILEYYDLSNPFELRNVAPGKHTLRVFVARSWHESYKNDGSFQMISFTVNSNETAPVPGKRQTMADTRAETKSSPVDSPAKVEPSKPLLTFNCPEGDYLSEEAYPVMIDFWLSNARLKGDGGEYRVRLFVDDDDAKYIDKWEPIWLRGWMPGKHTVRLELLGADQYPVQNGGYNIITREITVAR